MDTNKDAENARIRQNCGIMWQMLQLLYATGALYLLLRQIHIPYNYDILLCVSGQKQVSLIVLVLYTDCTLRFERRKRPSKRFKCCPQQSMSSSLTSSTQASKANDNGAEHFVRRLHVHRSRTSYRCSKTDRSKQSLSIRSGRFLALVESFLVGHTGTYRYHSSFLLQLVLCLRVVKTLVFLKTSGRVQDTLSRRH